ncbi:hypothetical protein BC827DRAFT_1384492 [Russula dissimulans]|nr:hypothetical protein BC827DRAFT_1384492 [Russula dissimulans]
MPLPMWSCCVALCPTPTPYDDMSLAQRSYRTSSSLCNPEARLVAYVQVDNRDAITEHVENDGLLGNLTLERIEEWPRVQKSSSSRKRVVQASNGLEASGTLERPARPLIDSETARLPTHHDPFFASGLALLPTAYRQDVRIPSAEPRQWHLAAEAEESSSDGRKPEARRYTLRIAEDVTSRPSVR